MIFSVLSVSLAAGSIAAGGLTATAKERSKNPEILYSQQYDTPTYIGEKWKAPKGIKKKRDVVFAYLEDKSKLFKMKGDVKDQFKILEEKEDKETDSVHFRLVETYKGIPVYGSDQAIALDDDNNVTSFFGQVIPDLNDKKIPSKAKISKTEAVKKVKKDLEKKIGDIEYDQDPNAELYVYPHKNKFYLAYLVKASFAKPEAGYWHYFVDATSGKIIEKFNAAHEATGSGKGVLGDTKSFETYYYGGTYYLYGTSRGGGIQTYDGQGRNYNDFGLPGRWVTSTDNYFRDPAAVDAHAYAERVYDYYKNTHARNSYDNRGAAIKSSVHVTFDGSKNNAAWIGTQMVYGDGDGTNYRPFSAALDVVGHELQHAVTEKEANLVYSYESGAINESLSDIFGAMVDRDDWLMGEDLSYTGKPMRSLSDPASIPNPLNPSQGYPDHYSKRYTGSADNGGVHINSSINNKAAYLIAQGGTHYGVTVTGIGKDKMEKIYYRALDLYLTSSSNFSSMRQAAIRAATDLYGAGSTAVTAVTKAYDAVGIK